MNDDAPRLLRAALADPVALCQRLGIDRPSKPNAGGLLVCCPVHGDKNPSCSVTTGSDGTVQVKCFGCDFTADALGLVAAVNGLDPRRDFREVLREAATLAGREDLLDEPRDERERLQRRRSVPRPEPRQERDFPDAGEVRALWERAMPVTDDVDASGMLVFRRIEPTQVRTLARVIQRGPLPRWAGYQRRSWLETGHRMLLPTYDAGGVMRGVRARLVSAGSADVPKCLPPAGCRSSGLVLANEAARRMFVDGEWPGKLWITEGETDFLAVASQTPDAVVGIGSGSWTEDHAGKVPFGTEVLLATDDDEAGDRYAHWVATTLSGRARLRRC